MSQTYESQYPFDIQIETNTAVEKILLTNEDEATLDIIAQSYKDDGALRTWSVTTKLDYPGQRTINIYAADEHEDPLTTATNLYVAISGEPDEPEVYDEIHEIYDAYFSKDRQRC